MSIAHRRHFACACLILWLACLGVGARAAEVTGRGYPFPVSTASSAASAAAPAPSQGQAAPVRTVQANPNTAPAVDFEKQPLAFTASGQRQSRGNGEYAIPSIWPALFSVALVCAVFCVILYLVKKYLPGHRQLFNHPAMEVLGRTHIDPKRYVSLLRVGKRILVIGVSPDEMRSLSEITDEEEITGIMEVARPKSEMGLTIFQRLFQRHVIDNDKAEVRAMANEKAAELEGQMASLRDRVRSIKKTEEPSRHVDAMG